MPANILHLPDFEVVRVEEADHDYHVYAEVSNPPVICTRVPLFSATVLRLLLISLREKKAPGLTWGFFHGVTTA
jgi:hypothetical protein